MFLLLAFELNSDQLKDTTIMISISFLVFILCRTTGSKPNLPRSDLLLEGKLNSRTKFRGDLLVTPLMQFYGGGVFYRPEECSDYTLEPVPDVCQVFKAGRLAYTCLKVVFPSPEIKS